MKKTLCASAKLHLTYISSWLNREFAWNIIHPRIKRKCFPSALMQPIKTAPKVLEFICWHFVKHHLWGLCLYLVWACLLYSPHPLRKSRPESNNFMSIKLTPAALQKASPTSHLHHIYLKKVYTLIKFYLKFKLNLLW